MTQIKATILPDGTRCYTGPTCKRHGVAAQAASNTVKAQTLRTEINALLTKTATTVEETVEVALPLPEWWNDYQQQQYENKVQIFKQFGLKNAKVPTFYEPAMQYGYIQVDTGDENTQLIVDTDGPYAKQGENYFCRAWMYKNGKPVAMLRFATYAENYTPPEGSYPHVESTICDVEVRKEHNGNGYSMEIIRQVEKNVLGGRLIHSGGSYTPEGYKALGGKLPYTHTAKYLYKKVFAEGKIPESSFGSMEFVHDWDNLQPLH